MKLPLPPAELVVGLMAELHELLGMGVLVEPFESTGLFAEKYHAAVLVKGKACRWFSQHPVEEGVGVEVDLDAQIGVGGTSEGERLGDLLVSVVTGEAATRDASIFPKEAPGEQSVLGAGPLGRGRPLGPRHPVEALAEDLGFEALGQLGAGGCGAEAPEDPSEVAVGGRKGGAGDGAKRAKGGTGARELEAEHEDRARPRAPWVSAHAFVGRRDVAVGYDDGTVCLYRVGATKASWCLQAQEYAVENIVPTEFGLLTSDWVTAALWRDR